MKKIVNINGNIWEIDDGIPIPETENRGAPSNPIFAALDNEAANEIKTGIYPNEREAAKAYLVNYGGEAYAEASNEVRNNKLRDIARRIQNQIDKR